MVYGLAPRRTQLTLRVATAVAGALTIVLTSSPPPVLADGNAGIHLAKTVDPAQTTVNPALSLNLGVDKASAIPGDTLTYTAVVTNADSIFGMGGTFTAEALGNVDGTVAYYWDELEACRSGCGDGQGNVQWVAFAGFVAGQPGYQPVVTPDAATGLSLTATSVPATGVTYPSSGDPILGTDITPQSTAKWNYQSTLTVTPSQIATLSDPTQVQGLRNVVHFEVTTRNSSAAEPYLDAELVNNPFQSQSNVGAVTNITVTFNLPDGSKATVDSSTVAGLASLAPGGSIAVTTTFKVPAPAARAAGDTDSAYLARLTALEGSSLNATASASGTGFSGTRTATASQVTTAEHLPIVTIFKSGPTQVTAGNTEVNPLTLMNVGGADAAAIAVTDSLPGGATGTVTGAPPNLSVAQSGSAQATYDVPASQTPGSLTDTAAVTWQDANGTKYGPLSSSFTTNIQSSLAGSRLTLSPATAGPDIVGNTQSFTANFVDSAGQPLVNKAIKLSITGANPGTLTASTDSNGNAQFSYTGVNKGTDQVQATFTVGSLTLQSNTVSVAWIAPIKTVSTTLVNAAVFFNDSCRCFAATPASTPVFTMQVPTINFNPPAGSVPHNPTQIGVFTRPMFDGTTDVAGNFTGAIELKGVDSSGVLHEAGTGDLFQFDMVLTGTFTIAATGNLTFNFFSDDGFIFGIQGATRVDGPLVNPPANMLTVFNGYPVMGAFNQPTAPVENNVTVSFPAPGTYSYEIDYNECCSGQLALTLATGGTGLPPTGNIALTPFTIAPLTVGQTQTLHAAVMDASGVAIASQPVTLNISGANPQQLAAVTDPTGLATFSYQGASPGQDSLQASAQVSGVPELSNVVTMTWNPAPPTPTISTPSPADGAIVSKPVPISAVITAPAGQSITSWDVSYQAAGGPVVDLKPGTGAPPSTLATFDPTVLVNGTYTITITANASGGGVQTSQSTIAVLGNLKLGRYVTTSQDLHAPVNGFQIQVLRSYDSLDKTQGDFGVGWRVSLANFRTAPNRVLGAGGWTQYNQSCVLGLCFTAFKNSAPRFVTVVFPDQHSEIFDFTPAGGTNVFFGCTPTFTARASAGTTSTLVPLDGTTCSYTGDGNLYGSGGGFYNPQRFQLNTINGTVLVLDHNLGLVSETDPNSNFLKVTAAGVTSSSGPSITFDRDSQGRIARIHGPNGELLQYSYSAGGDLQTYIDANNNQTSFSYDTDHNLTGITGPNGPVETLNYVGGRLVSVTRGDGNTTQIVNDVAGQRQTVLDPNQTLTTIYTYDDLGDVVQLDRTFGSTTLSDRWTYDVNGHVLSYRDALGNPSTAVYDASGNLIKVTDANGKVFQYTYNNLGEVTSVIDPSQNTVQTYVYDSHGNRTQWNRADHSQFLYQYSSGGVVTQITDHAGRTTQYAYDSNGHLAQIIANGSNVTQVVCDASGRVTKVIDSDGKTTRYTYDGLGDLVSALDDNNHQWLYTFDFQSRLTQIQDPLGHQRKFQYDPAGNLSQVTDRDGRLIQFQYDADGRLARKTLPGNDVTTYTYDPVGQLIEAANSDSDVKFVFDAAGNIAQTTSGGTATSNQPTVTLSYTYDANGNKTSLTGPDGQTFFGYNVWSQLTSVKDPAGRPFSLNYDTSFRLTSIQRPNGVNDALTYDSSDVLTAIASAHLGTPVATLSYLLDANGRANSVTDPNGTTTFNRDPLGQLTSAVYAGAAFPNDSFQYDGAGNRIASAAGPSTYDSANHLLSGPAATYQFDNEGDLTQRTDASGTTRFTFNADHRLLSITHPDSTVTSFRYDPFGRRIEINDAGAITRYAYDSNDIHVEYDGLNNLVASYVDGSGTDFVLEMVRGGQPYYYLRDAVGSTTALVDGSGTVVDTYRYSAFGAQIATGSVANPFTYTGREYDAKSGLYYYRERWYDPRAGRFISEDPSPAVNLYPYAFNDPVTFSDPLGDQAFVEYETRCADDQEVFVYAAREKGGCYIGISNNVARRTLEHARGGVRAFTKVLQLSAKGLNRLGARGVEQRLIELLQSQGYTVTNAINSIADTSEVYPGAVGFGGDLIQSLDLLSAVMQACFP